VGAKLRLGFAQAILVTMVCIEQGFGFLSFVQASHIV
jgi:hypothetical protein